MEEKEVKLSVKNLSISFRTDAGKVQAVRDISFDLYKGETLALVGESGSGKSVTNRAIIGILAGNAIKEGGEILYDGQDLMKIDEDHFHKIRGDKIAMIFQDPMSSLNPIMRIGKQITEAMVIKGKISQKESRKDFNRTLSLLNAAMDAAHPENKTENGAKCKKFDQFEYKHLELQQKYNRAKEAADDALAEIDDILFRIEKNALAGVQRDIAEVVKVAADSCEEYVVNLRAEELKGLLAQTKKLCRVSVPDQAKKFLRILFNRGESDKIAKLDYAALAELLKKIRGILSDAVSLPMPNFFAMGYYLTFEKEPLPDLPVEELNAFLRKRLDEDFMLDFISLAEEGLRHSNAQAVESKKRAIAQIDETLPVFRAENLSRKEALAAKNKLVSVVRAAIDPLEIVKDNVAYTFHSGLESAIALYFDGIERNRKEEKRFAKQTAQFEKSVARGKTPGWKVADKSLVDLDKAREDVVATVLRVREDFEKAIAASPALDFHAKAVDLIDYFKEKAAAVVHKVTRRMAKMRALKLLEEVGIPEPRKRFRQYPFEFSGGMRQRIVIAIALSANPDILICDEPTTALDVTIQSQILELINRVKEERQLSVIFITHDLGVVANMADRVAVMYAGKIVEIGTTDDIFYSPAHPYTWALLSSMPDLDTKEKLEAIPGTPPNMIYPPKGDAFAERNKYAMQIDFEQQPPMFRISDTHYAATWLLHPDAPKVDPPKSVTDRIRRMKEAGRKRNEQ